MNYHETFSANLRYYLEEAGKTQADLARYMNTATSTTSDWCNARKIPRMDKIRIIANWLGVDMADLLEENGSRFYWRRKANELLSSIEDDNLEQICNILETFRTK